MLQNMLEYNLLVSVCEGGLTVFYRAFCSRTKYKIK